jgi:hypothetical protein
VRTASARAGHDRYGDELLGEIGISEKGLEKRDQREIYYKDFQEDLDEKK